MGIEFTAQRIDALYRDSSAPLWVQVRDQIRNWIFTSAETNSKLPSEAQMCADFGVSRTVIRDAVSELVAEGLIYKIVGSGAYVTEHAKQQEFVAGTIGFGEDMLRRGARVRTRILEQRLRPATEAEAQHLSIDAGTEVVSLHRARDIDGSPGVLVHTALPAKVTPGLQGVALEDRSLYDVLRRQYGLAPARAERWITATSANEHESATLGIQTGSPVLRIESVAWLADGRPLEYYAAVHRPDVAPLHIHAR